MVSPLLMALRLGKPFSITNTHPLTITELHTALETRTDRLPKGYGTKMFPLRFNIRILRYQARARQMLMSKLSSLHSQTCPGIFQRTHPQLSRNTNMTKMGMY